jgi:hypothetical protein
MPCDRAFQKSEILFNFCVNGLDGCVRVAEAIGGHKNNDVWRPDLPNFGFDWSAFLGSNELSHIISTLKTNPLKCWGQESEPYVKSYLFDEHHVFHVSRFT